MPVIKKMVAIWGALGNKREQPESVQYEEPMIRLVLERDDRKISAVPLEEEWNESVTRIGKELKFFGCITQREGMLAILGEVEGSVTQINREKGSLIIGPEAKLKGTVICGAARIHGGMDATMDATQVIIERTAKTRGSIRYSEIEIAKGGDNKVGLSHRVAN